MPPIFSGNFTDPAMGARMTAVPSASRLSEQDEVEIRWRAAAALEATFDERLGGGGAAPGSIAGEFWQRPTTTTDGINRPLLTVTCAREEAQKAYAGVVRRLKHLVKRAFRALGVEVSRYRDVGGERRVGYMRTTGISLVLDVGAHTGQYARKLRRSGYGGRIVSFEPLEAPFRELREQCARDPRWECRQLAIGERAATVEINVSGNEVSSSLLPMLPRHSEARPVSRYVSREMADMTTLDLLFDELIGLDDRVALKLDVQGYEDRVLEGAQRTLSCTHVLEAELSLVPLYEEQAPVCEIVQRIQAKGLGMVSLVTGMVDPRNDQILQIDGIFMRTGA